MYDLSFNLAGVTVGLLSIVVTSFYQRVIKNAFSFLIDPQIDPLLKFESPYFKELG